MNHKESDYIFAKKNVNLKLLIQKWQQQQDNLSNFYSYLSRKLSIRLFVYNKIIIYEAKKRKEKNSFNIRK